MPAAKRSAMSAVLAAALLLMGCGGEDSSEKQREGAEGGKSASESAVLFRFEQFTSAPLVDGGEVTLRSLEGQVVLLDLFGTWCPPCRRSIPLIVSLYQRFNEKGLEVVGLAYERTNDTGQAAEMVKAFREEFKIPYTLALGLDGVWPELEKKAGARGAVPTLVLIDRQGIARYMFQGLQPGEEAVLAERLEKLLAEPAVAVPR